MSVWGGTHSPHMVMPYSNTIPTVQLRDRLSVAMVHFRPLPRRLPPRGALNDVLTSTCSVGSDRHTWWNGLTPMAISHILVGFWWTSRPRSDAASGYQRLRSTLLLRRQGCRSSRCYCRCWSTIIHSVPSRKLVYHVPSSYDRRRLGARTDAAWQIVSVRLASHLATKVEHRCPVAIPLSAFQPVSGTWNRTAEL